MGSWSIPTSSDEREEGAEESCEEPMGAVGSKLSEIGPESTRRLPRRWILIGVTTKVSF
jgi:hypothetical protein